MDPIQLRFGAKDADLASYFRLIEKGSKAPHAKDLIRLGIAIKGLTTLELLINRGIVDPAMLHHNDQPAVVNKGLSIDDRNKFLLNMAASWDSD